MKLFREMFVCPAKRFLQACLRFPAQPAVSAQIIQHGAIDISRAGCRIIGHDPAACDMGKMCHQLADAGLRAGAQIVDRVRVLGMKRRNNAARNIARIDEIPRLLAVPVDRNVLSLSQHVPLSFWHLGRLSCRVCRELSFPSREPTQLWRVFRP